MNGQIADCRVFQPGGWVCVGMECLCIQCGTECLMRSRLFLNDHFHSDES